MTPRKLASRIVVGVVLGSGLALAQTPPSGDKGDAKALMQTGVRLLEAKDYRGALAIFKDAYQRFASAKILLNIGTTLKLLARNAEAANTYQRYLDSPDADAAKKLEVSAAIAELDKTVGYLEISVTPADAEVQVNSDDWMPAKQATRYRVNQGQFTVNARKEKFQTEAKSAQIAAGEKAAVSIALTALPEERQPDGPNGGNGNTTGNGNTAGGISSGGATERSPSRLGGYVLGHIDPHPDHLGFAMLIGAIAHITGALQVRGAAIVGPTYGGFIGASFAFLPGNVRPFAAVGLPIFFSDGARIGFRGAGGVEYRVTRHLSLIGELGIEYPISYEQTNEMTLLIPALGAAGRL